jgi:predicted nucleic acid-binding protein
VAVLDASVLVAYLAGFGRVEAVRARILAGAGTLWAPHLVDAEVGHVLRRAVAGGDLDAGAAAAALSDLAGFPLRRVAHVGLLERAWALRENVSFYDALYVALAELLDEPLLTLDARLATAPGVSAEIVVVE